MTVYRLPPGYEIYPPSLPRGVEQTAPGVLTVIPNEALYGGADVSRMRDAAGTTFIACCARGPDNDFRFRVFAFDAQGGPARDLVLQHRATGRGEVALDEYDRRLHWIAWEGSEFFTDIVPGAVPFTTATDGPAIVSIGVEAGTPIYQLYLGEYVSDAQLQSAPGMYVRFNKLLLALRQVVAILETTGVIHKG